MLLFNHSKKSLSLASKILIGMLAGFIVGFLFQFIPPSHFVNIYIINGLFEVVGKIFITLLEMLVVPIVFVSLVCGVCHLGGGEKFGRLSVKVLAFFIITTMIAVTIGVLCATISHVGENVHLTLNSHFIAPKAMTIKDMILNLIPSNLVEAMAQGNLLQIIIFALLLGIAISMAGAAGKRIGELFSLFNAVLMKLIELVMRFAPYGVFCLIAVAFANIGLGLIEELLLYCLIVMLALAIQLFVTYGLSLSLIAKLNPIIFFRKMASVMLFAFSTSSSNATIPFNLEVTEEKLGVDNSIAAFTIPLGATMHMDGTAIMQGVASVFIAHIYHVGLTMASYITIVLMATLASISTGGVPGVGILSLAMVLQQAGLPLEGIGLLIGVDRLIDMLRTIVNIAGDSVTACIVAKSEKTLNIEIYNKK